ncbi:hypothetical protein [Hungatella hathewayi]|uniref:hypothetical protein n=1 Tax=Hungatella hathewayi TaxID=154046 RepID=UPI0035657566
MKNNIFYKTCFVLAVSASLIGCSNNTDNLSSIETTISESVSISVVDTEPATEHVDNTKPAEQNALVTVGTLKDLSEVIDNYGNKQALFTDENGTEFIAIVSEQTLIPEDFSLDKDYEVYHSDDMTMSIPGQYSEVYEIKKVDDISNPGIISESSTEDSITN